MIVYVFDGVQRFNQARRWVGNLPIGQDLARPDGIAVANFPWVDADEFRQFI